MRASWRNHVIAESDELIAVDGYQYFPRAAVRMEWLEPSPKTAEDRQCPHGVQFYDLVVGGMRHARAAWSYEAPQASMARVARRIGFWGDVQVA